MLFDTPIISEGAVIINTTVESGAAYPANASIGEIFFRTDLNDFVFRNAGAWYRFASKTDFDAHTGNNTIHLSAAEKTLISGITVTAADINSIPDLQSSGTSTLADLNAHKANMNVHLTTAQNTFLDGLNLPTLTAANVNTLTGVTTNVQTQFTNQTTATNTVATNLATHIDDQTVHVIAAQRTWLDGINFTKITPTVMNGLDVIVAGGSAALRVAKSGDTMTGALNMGSNKVTSSAVPTVDADLANKKYVDDRIIASAPDLTVFVKKSGDTMTGILNMGNQKITGVGTPTVNSDATPKIYVDNADALRVAKAGDTMTGLLNMGANKVTSSAVPTADIDLANKKYVDDVGTAARTASVAKAGDTMTGALNMGTNKVTSSAAPTAGADLTNKTFVDAQTGLKVNKAGDTMTGTLNMGANKVTTSGAPSADIDLTNKKYVDDAIVAAVSVPGAAATAQRLATARTFTLSGGATGQTTAAFDGSANATINVTSLSASALSGQIAATVVSDLGLGYIGTLWTGTDFNALTALADSKRYTIQESILRANGPEGTGQIVYNGWMQITRRGETIGRNAITQTVNVNGYIATRNCTISGTDAAPVYTWQPWEYLTTRSLGDGVDLDTLRFVGRYAQATNNGATTGANYPGNVAGVLTVTSTGVTTGNQLIVTQMYQVYGSANLTTPNVYNQVYVRSFYSTWSPWKRLAQADDVVTVTGDQTIAGNKTFSGRIISTNTTSGASGGAIATSGGFYSGATSDFAGVYVRGTLTSTGRAFEFGDLTTTDSVYIDFHSSGNATDYDSRIIATGGTTAAGNGNLEIIGRGGIQLTGPVSVSNTGNIITGNVSGTAAALATAYNINGVPFNGTGHININGYFNSANAGATAPVTGTTRYSGASGIYYDNIYQGTPLGWPIQYGSRQLIIGRNGGTANAAQHEFVYEWASAGGSDRIFYRSVGDVSTYNWRPYKEIAFTDSPSLIGTPTAPTASRSASNSTQLATTAFANELLRHFGLSQADSEASSSIHLTANGVASNDLNLYVGAINGGYYTMAGTYLNGPLGASVSYTGVLNIIRRRFDAGPAVTQILYLNFGNNDFRVYMRSGNTVASVWTWSNWERNAFESSNVASATKLNTARTITVGGVARTFDGTGNITFPIVEPSSVGPNVVYGSDLLNESRFGIDRPFGFIDGGNATGRTKKLVPYLTSPLRNAFRNECTSATVGQYLDITTDATNITYPAEPGQLWTISATVRGTPGAEFRQYIQCRDSTGATIYTYNSPVTNVTDTFARYSMSMNTPIPANTVALNVYFARVTRTASTPAAMWMEVAEPQLQLGTVATPYEVSNVRHISGETSALFAGADFNNLVIEGDYILWAGPGAMLNTPATSYWGKLNVVRNGERIFQSYIADTTPYLEFNRMSTTGGTTWKDWAAATAVTDLGVSYGVSQVAVTSSTGTNALIAVATSSQAGVLSAADKTKLDSVATGSTRDWGAGIAITTNGTDLNTYQSPGAYFCSANAVSQTLLNNPTTKAFSLQIYQAAGVIQELTEYTSNSTALNRKWIRGFYNGNWSAWQEMLTAQSGVQTLGLTANPTKFEDYAGALVNGVNAFAITGASMPTVFNDPPFAGTPDAVLLSIGYSFEAAQMAFNNGVIRVRGNDGNPGTNAEWTAWRELATTDFKPTYAFVADTATALASARSINGTSFNGTANITTANWGTARTLTIGNSGKSVNGSANVSWTLAEIGAIGADSPAFTGTPTAPTASTATNNTQIATTAYVKANLAALDASSLTIGTVPNARMSGTYDGMSLKVNGANTVFSDSSAGNSNANGRVIFGMASYRSNVSTATGAIVFTAPSNASAIMHEIEVTVMTYSPARVAKLLINGYRSNSTTFSNTSTVQLGSQTVQVRWGIDASGRSCLILGDVGTVWSYPHASASIGMVSHNSVTDAYCTGWTSNLVTDLSTYTGVLAAPDLPSVTDITGNAATATSATTAASADSATTAASAAILTTTRQINGTNFNGSASITTANWGTARTLTLGSSGKSVNGSANVSWTLAEMGAAPIASPAFTGNVTATGDITAFYSDERLKKDFTQLTGALNVIKSLTGYRYFGNDLAASFGYDTDVAQVGFKAQDVQKVIPEAVRIAPFDADADGNSKSGENYLTLKYEKIVPHLVEAVKELSTENMELKTKVETLEARIARLEALLIGD